MVAQLPGLEKVLGSKPRLAKLTLTNTAFPTCTESNPEPIPGDVTRPSTQTSNYRTKVKPNSYFGTVGNIFNFGKFDDSFMLTIDVFQTITQGEVKDSGILVNICVVLYLEVFC